MNDTDAQVMLTLAGLTYRGFADIRSGEPHADILAQGVLDGLGTLGPVKDNWDLVWGPVTSRGPRAVFDSSAMYVVRERRPPHRYVVAIRGTNPVSASDWLLGDLWVTTTVPWPYAPPDGAALSASTAVGLATLQAMRAPAVASTLARVATLPPATRMAEHSMTEFLEHSKQFAAGILETIQSRLQPGEAARGIPTLDLRPTLSAPAPASGDPDLLTFLKTESDAAPDALNIVVAGHSKGGALAPALALWLEEARASGAAAERWDTKGSAQVSCYAFAGPTPGNAAFAARVGRMLGARYQHLRNAKDIVTHAWQDDELRAIPGLYGVRSKVLDPLIRLIASQVQQFGYAQTPAFVRSFVGGLGRGRPFGVQFIHQHMEAYLEEIGLAAGGIHAADFFF